MTLAMSNRIDPSGLSGCFRCGFVWKPCTLEPRICPRCKSRSWDVPVIRPVRGGRGLGIPEIVVPLRAKLDQALRANRARHPRVFGSVARGEAQASSDLDLLVDFDRRASAFDQVNLIAELEELFGRKVDVTEPSGLHWLVRPQVLCEAVPI